MHIPDGFFDAGTSLGAGVVAAGGVRVAVHRSRAALEDKHIPLAGLMAGFIFAAQMLNFPVWYGTSGHVLGGTLAAVLLGPHLAALCLTVVLFVQMFFADGGVTAFGLNVTIVALTSTYGGYGVFLVARRVLRRAPLPAAAGVAAWASVVFSAAAFVVAYWIGGTADVSIGSVAAAMLAVHALIGIGEGLITAAAVGLVLGVRPDVVYARTAVPGAATG